MFQLSSILGKRSSTNFQFDSLDGLRGLAVLLVLAGHFSHSGLTYGVDFGGAGTIGVYCFFVLSSFLLATPLIRLEPENLAKRGVWLNYAARRLLRIYPLYCVLLIFYYALSTFRITPPSAGLYFEEMDLLRHFFLVDAKEYLWTIQVETKFYFVLPILVFISVIILRNKPVNVLLAGGFGILIAVAALDGTESRGSLLLQFPVFVSGFVGAVLYNSMANRSNSWPASTRQMANILAGILLMLIFSFLPTFSGFVYDGGMDASVLKQPYIFGVLWAVFLICVLYSQGMITKLLETRVLRFVGIISFSVYLWHVPILAVAKRVQFMDGVLGLLVVLPLIFIVSTVSYLYIERPFLLLRIVKNKTEQ